MKKKLLIFTVFLVFIVFGQYVLAGFNKSFLLLDNLILPNSMSLEPGEKDSKQEPDLKLSDDNFDKQNSKNNFSSSTSTCSTQAIPFVEGFNTTSSTFSCWTIVDGNGDGSTWKTTTSSYSGDQAMYFSSGMQKIGAPTPKNDEWLITPSIQMDSTKIYELTYYYRTAGGGLFGTGSGRGDYGVYLSTEGADVTKFTDVLSPLKTIKNTTYVEDVIYISGKQGVVNIGWNIKYTGSTDLYIDEVAIRAIDCPNLSEQRIKNIKSDKVTIYWEDDFNDEWEYIVQAKGEGFPTAAGIKVNANEIEIDKDSKGNSLLPSTDYEYYVRSSCKNNKYGDWTGPFLFVTLCKSVFTIPFSEGFDSTSLTLDCWTVIDGNNDDKYWLPDSSAFSGDQAMLLSAGSTKKHDDWLTSPLIEFDSTKIYKLSFYYKTKPSSFLTSFRGQFEVVISDGAMASDKEIIVPAKTITNSAYKEEIVFISGIGGVKNLSWHVTHDAAVDIYIDHLSLEEMECMKPSSLGGKDIGGDKFTIYWEDELNDSWEFYVQDSGEGEPSGAGTSTSANEVIINKDFSGDNISENKEYEFYVRAVCLNGKFSDWSGPFKIRTTCKSVNLPFKEDFEEKSLTVDCWAIVNKDGDGVKWTLSKTTPYEGTYSMRYYKGGGIIIGPVIPGPVIPGPVIPGPVIPGPVIPRPPKLPLATKANNSLSPLPVVGSTTRDYLISPTIEMDSTAIYQLTYYYKTSSSTSNEFEVLLSKKGTQASDFETVLVPNEIYKNAEYLKKVVYIKNTGGSVNIAWHVTSSANMTVNIDLVSIEKVDCMGVVDVNIDQVEHDKAVFSWEDDYNTQWEYYLQKKGGVSPVGGGTLSNSKTITVTRESISGSPSLQANTEYEIYVRSSCGSGKMSAWIGPVSFKTLCGVYSVPFSEGFNKGSGGIEGSESIDCWTIIDANNDSQGGETGDNIWKPYEFLFYEGNQSMRHYGYTSSTSKRPHDDWLISPKIKLEKAKTYRLKYQYQTNSSYSSDFEVLISDSGIDITSFTKTLISKKGSSDSNWKEEVIILNGYDGVVNIAWHVTSSNVTTMLLIDDITIEEVKGCPEPFDLGVEDIEADKATLKWTDEIGSEWEYVVQKARGIAPVSGTSSTQNSIVIDKDKNGNTLSPNTEYEFYVRTKCSNTDFSSWSGPYVFRTGCGVVDLPFWEGFNKASTTLSCWSVVDRNKDAILTMSTDRWNYRTNKYEGDQSMSFYGSSNKTHDDWLISPLFNFDKNKIYRLKYHYSTDNNLSHTNEFEVLLSDSGLDTDQFTKVIIPNRRYSNSSVWIEEHVFIDNVKGESALAWHVTSPGGTYIYIDNVFIEEVEGCPEPLKLSVDNIEANQVDISWEDDMGGSSWEYYIQRKDEGLPKTNGTVTTKKENTVDVDAFGSGLDSNTDYEFYVRTVCGNGEYSVWNGPYYFVTLCEVYSTPFFEGFNTDIPSIRCWTIMDQSGGIIPEGSTWKTTSTKYEGDQAIYYQYSSDTSKNLDDWLISPEITFDGGMYILKYHYRTNEVTNAKNQFEVLLSKDGIGNDKFTSVIVPLQNKYTNQYTEQVSFINGIKGDVNLAWHINAKSSIRTNLYIDNIIVKKIETCPEPYYVKRTGETSTTIDIEWQQEGGVVEWEVLVVNYGDDENGLPIQKQSVKGLPQATISGLIGGQVYTIYVRAKCVDGSTVSDWSTPINTVTKVTGGYDDCTGAKVIPVNNSLECIKTVSGTLLGATESSIPAPNCASNLKNDVWFEFTATSETHLFSIKEVKALQTTSLTPLLYGAIYVQDCAKMTASPIGCFSVGEEGDDILMTGMSPGQKIFVRLGNYVRADDKGKLEEDQPDFIFTICITTSEYGPVEVSPSGEKYSVEELVKDVLIGSDCDLVENVRYQVGDGNNSINALGYFNKSNSMFPFEEGIVLATGDVKHIPGPYTYKSINDQRDKIPTWTGDPDLNKVIDDLGGSGFGSNKHVAVLEFDFTPITDSIKFEYLFASQSYHISCTTSGCSEGGALFAAWLTDLETGEGQNLALVPGTNQPIALSTIRDTQKSGHSCESRNKEFYWKHYDRGFDNILDAPINFVGLTLPLSSEMVKVKSCHKYRIKLAIADFCSSSGHTSAVFFNARSFDLGNIDLGEDLLVETNNALCDQEVYTIKSGVKTDQCGNTEFQWYKDGNIIDGATNPDLEVHETGDYELVVRYPEIKCEFKGNIRIEIYPAISKVVHKPAAFETCRFSLFDRIVDLSLVEAEMFADVNKEDYTIAYYLTEEEALEGGENTIDETSYRVEGTNNVNLYIRVEDTRTGCHEIFVLHIQVEQGVTPSKPENVAVCAEYIFPKVDGNQYYYTESGGNGKKYKAGDILAESGEHIIYLLQLNSEDGCYEETSYRVDITAPVFADVFENTTLSCEYYELKPLSQYNSYHTEPQRGGIELYEGMTIVEKQTIYVYASSKDSLCIDESSFTINYDDCPIPRGISPNNDGLNDVFDLTPHGVENIKIYNRWGTEVYSYDGSYTTQWHGQGKNGKQLPDGTYYYVIIAHGKTRTGWVQINK
ncbi:choice-of-anchor J domain-containing protein [Myroides indicus]|uniref:Cleaved adhesin domain-containing protein n=1 Tax=Myroides indicus TaxID=1323422 RepID=A0A4R7FAE1_9FLAO|nr:choice-of-anchor J domain-containing protein [Myroides indicus]TDS64288.1 cleaved adhesin domain-containing protein [Myroides indicus]